MPFHQLLDSLCAGTFGRATSANGSISGSGSLLSFAKLYKTAHAVITRSDVWTWSRRSKLRHGNLLFKTPNVCSIFTLALDRAVLKRLSASVLVASSGVIRNGRSGYPLSPNRTPLISWFSNLAQRALLTNILLSCVVPGHRTTVFVMNNSWSHVAEIDTQNYQHSKSWR